MEKLKITALVPDPNQPRKLFEPTRLRVLYKSVEDHGIISPLIVEKINNGKYLIVDGERRFRVASEMGLKEVPVIVIDPQNKLDRLIQQFHIQEQHENWSGVEKAMAIQAMAEESKVSPRELLRSLGVPTRTATNYISYLAIMDKDSWDKSGINTNWADGLQNLKLSVRKAYEIEDLEYDNNVAKKVEKAFINAVVTGTLEKRNDISLLRDSFAKNPKSVASFIEKGMSPQEIFSKEKARSAYYLRNFKNSCVVGKWHAMTFMNKPDTKVGEDTLIAARTFEIALKQFLDKYDENR